jgi:4a-hydroxytetrahydrobiopterin dehydratase
MSNVTPSAVSARENALVRPKSLTRLKPERVQLGLRKLPSWRPSRDGKALVRTFKFTAERAPLVFAELVLAIAEKEGHQPTLTLSGGTVECRLCTPAAGGITLRDLEMARRISTLG